MKISHKDGRMTVIGLTAASGDAVMVIIIFAVEELTFEQQMGHGICVPFNEEVSIAKNSGPGKTLPGGLSCTFRGKVIPALITSSKKGSITSEILKHAFERLDQLGIYACTPELTPFALFDAHDSRLRVPFLRYINEQLHKWVFCIGLPNGTHKWQVGDSKEQNGSWKVEWVREKSKLVLFRTRMGLSSDIDKSDILPLINRIWPRSFARKCTNQQAISDRGWNPLNCRLLTDPEIIKTRSATSFTPAPTAAISDTPSNINLVSIDTAIMAPSPTTIVPPPLECQTIATASTFAQSTCSSIETLVVPSPWIDLDNINFDKGLAGEFSIDILQYIVKKERVRDNLSKRY